MSTRSLEDQSRQLILAMDTFKVRRVQPLPGTTFSSSVLLTHASL
ncbi:hypothetical protein [Symbiopectobacterium purcellii]